MVRPEIVGAWRLIDCVCTDAAGKVSHPWGADALGLLLYTADGHMSAAINQPDGKGGRRQLSYCGRVECVGEENLHRIEISPDPALVGTVQRRRVTLKGDTLTLTASPSIAFGPGSTADLVWRRADAQGG